MEGKRLLHTLRLANFLSYGPEGEEIELQPLNVLIGPNGSGKSNLIEAISLLKAAPENLSKPLRAGGGMPQWTWKGGGGSPAIDLRVETTVSHPDGPVPLRYWFQLMRVGQQLEVVDEGIENASRADKTRGDAEVFYAYREGTPILRASGTGRARPGTDIGRRDWRLDRHDLNPGELILSQRKDPKQYPELTYLGKTLSRIAFFRECNLGQRSPLRGPQQADLPSDFLRRTVAISV